jgi:tetratricopeptide (TPR) repeat protein
MTGPATAAGVEELERTGDRSFRKGRYAEAAEAYKRALLLAGDDQSPRRVELIVKLGDLAQAVGKPHAALGSYMKALGLDPLHVDAFQGAVGALLERRDYDAIDELMRRRMDALTSDDDKVESWRVYATLWLDNVKDYGRALTAVEALLAIRPEDPQARERLPAVLEALDRNAQAVEAYTALAGSRQGPAAAATLHHAAELARDKLGDPLLAAGLVERALAVEPDRPGLLEMAESLLADEAEAPRLATLYQWLLDHASAKERQLVLAKKLGGLAVYRMQDFALAERALLRAQVLDPRDAELCRTLAAARATQGAYDRAIATCRAAIRLEPREPSSYRLGKLIFEHMGSADGAYCAAGALECLGAATADEVERVAAERPEGLLAVQGVLSNDDWQSTGLCAERDVTTHDLLAAIGGPARWAKLEVLQRARSAPKLDPSQREDVRASTAMMVRAVPWVCQLLSIQAPDLYLCNDLPGDIAPVPAATPAVQATRALGSGLSPKQLAFLWGRGLSVFRPEHYLAVFYPSADDLVVLLEAVRKVTSGARASGAAGRLAEALEKFLPSSEREHVSMLLDGVGDPRAAARSWLASCELSAARAGLLCTGDTAEAVALLQQRPFGRATSVDEQIDDLLVFSMGVAYHTLRARIGVAVGRQRSA